MNIIPNEINDIVILEFDNKVICANYNKNIITDKPMREMSLTQVKDISDAYVIFDLQSGKIIERHNILEEDFGTICYIRIKNKYDENGDNLKLCYYIPLGGENKEPVSSEVSPKSFMPNFLGAFHSWINKKYIIILFLGICITIILIMLWPNKKPESPKIIADDDNIGIQSNKNDSITYIRPIIEDHLMTKGYLCFSAPDSVKVKMYVSSNTQANGNRIDWEKVETYILHNDTLYPKRSCKVFLRAFPVATIDSVYCDYSYEFNMPYFVQNILLKITDKTNKDVAKDFFLNLDKNHLLFDNGLEQKEIASIRDLNDYVIEYIKQDPIAFKIDSVAFYNYSASVKGKTIFYKRYPSIKYIRLK